MRVVLMLVVAAGCGRFGFDLVTQGSDDDAGDPDSADGAGVMSRRLYVGYTHSCVIEPDGAVRCWGANSRSQLGLGVGADSDAPVPTVPDRTHVMLGLGQYHSCGLDDAGNIRCWGGEGNGELGRSPPSCANGSVDNGETCDDLNWDNNDGCTSQCQSGALPPDATTPVAIESALVYKALYAYRFSTFAIAGDGTLWSWGRNGARQLGIGDNADRGRPFQVLVVAPQTGPNDQWVQVAMGSDHTCARQQDNSLWCWGGDGLGQLGQGASPYVRERPNRVGTSEWLDVATGNDFSCGLQIDGTAWCWGLNDHYQLGLGDITNRFAPTLVELGPFVQITAGAGHACAITGAGEMSCWGWNLEGQIGVGTTAGHVMTPTVVPGDWVDMGGGSFYSCGLRRDSEVYCWGQGDNGRLGDGASTGSNVPVRVLL